MNYYNENDPFAANWLKELIKAELIPNGEVDDRSIADVEPQDLVYFNQHHFFAGIGGWPYALELSGWNADRPVWTGSCPCQSLSCAGKGLGEKDERHLWPIFCSLIEKLRPPTVFGEQVASKDGREWLSGVRNDLEALGYAVGAADLPAASIGAPHKRNRLFWVGYASGQGLPERRSNERIQQKTVGSHQGEAVIGGSDNGWVANANGQRQQGKQIRLHKQSGNGKARQEIFKVAGRSGNGRLANTKRNGRRSNQQGWQEKKRTFNFWFNSAFIQCADGKARRVPGRVADNKCKGLQERERKSGKAIQRIEWTCGSDAPEPKIEPVLFPLANGVQNRVGILRGAGNAIVPQVAAEFITAFMNINH
jgi:DNA (cytosine-5)-methyltransferase 1